MNESKSQPITKEMVWVAYQQVAAKGGTAAHQVRRYNPADQRRGCEGVEAIEPEQMFRFIQQKDANNTGLSP